MGRIKTKLVKRVTEKLIRDNKDKFTGDYKENKVALNKLITVESKKIKNMIAGFITRKIRKSN